MTFSFGILTVHFDLKVFHLAGSCRKLIEIKLTQMNEIANGKITSARALPQWKNLKNLWIHSIALYTMQTNYIVLYMPQIKVHTVPLLLDDIVVVFELSWK